MEQLIDAILEIEKKAQELKNEAVELEKKVDIEASNAESVKEEFFKKAREKVENFHNEENKYLELTFKEIEKELNENLKTINQKYEENKDKWVDTLYNNIIKA